MTPDQLVALLVALAGLGAILAVVVLLRALAALMQLPGPHDHHTRGRR